VEKALTRYKPEVVICFSGEARLHLGKPITMGTQDILEIHKKLPAARIIAVHFGTFNHCRLTRNALREFARTEGFEQQLIIPADGEYVYCNALFIIWQGSSFASLLQIAPPCIIIYCPLRRSSMCG
jgi:hypothetical protein